MLESFDQQTQLQWRKARKSNPNGACVQLAPTSDGNVAMRNSRDPQGPVLYFTKRELDAFLDGARKREFDDLAQ